MNYEKIYQQLVDKRRKEKPPKDVYIEKHHIIPRCLGGDDSKHNVISVTAKEHYICHYLLCKIHHSGPNHWKMIKAFGMMNWCENYRTQKRHKYINSRTFAWAREQFAKAQSYQTKGKNNSQHGTMWITDGIESKKIPKTDNIPDGWFKGRKMSKTKLLLEPKQKIHIKSHIKYVPNLSYEIKQCGKCNYKEKEQEKKIIAQYHYDKIIKYGYASIRNYCANNDIGFSDVTLQKYFKKHLKLNIQHGKPSFIK